MYFIVYLCKKKCDWFSDGKFYSIPTRILVSPFVIKSGCRITFPGRDLVISCMHFATKNHLTNSNCIAESQNVWIIYKKTKLHLWSHFILPTNCAFYFTTNFQFVCFQLTFYLLFLFFSKFKAKKKRRCLTRKKRVKLKQSRVLTSSILTLKQLKQLSKFEAL